MLNRLFLLLPVRGETTPFFLEVGQLFFELRQPLHGGFVPFLAERFAFDLQLHDAPLDLIQLGRHRIDFHAELRCGLVDEIDGLVREEPVGDVPIREDRRRDQRGVLEFHAVVNLVPVPQSSQDTDRIFNSRLSYDHRLEPTLECGVLFDVLAILIQRGRTNGVQFAARQHRFQHVRGVHRALGGPGPNDGVELVDEQYDLALGVCDLLEHRLQAFLELAAILRARYQRSHVERHDPFVLEPLGHVAADDAAGQALDDRGLPDTGFADQHGIVLRAAGEDLNDTPDFFVPADDRIERAFTGELGQVAAVAFQCLIGRFGVLARDPL